MCTKPTLGHNIAFLIQARLPGRALARTTCPNELTRMPSNDPHELFYMGGHTTQTNRQGRARKTSCTNMHKANLGSQLSIFYTGSFVWACPCSNDPPEQVDMDALKRPAQTLLHGCPHDPNEPTRESWANELHEHAQSQPRVTT